MGWSALAVGWERWEGAIGQPPTQLKERDAIAELSTPNENNNPTAEHIAHTHTLTAHPHPPEAVDHVPKNPVGLLRRAPSHTHSPTIRSLLKGSGRGRGGGLRGVGVC